ncbi:hypothetical protein U1Q18_027620, partial [Sarracenia purpurea var. burkii]
MLALMGSVIGITIDVEKTKNINVDKLVDYCSTTEDGSEKGTEECQRPWRTQ